MNRILVPRVLFTLLLTTATLSAAEVVWLDSLDLKSLRQGWGQPQVNRSIREQPLTIAGQVFERGGGTHATSTYRILLNRGTERFTARGGGLPAPCDLTPTEQYSFMSLWALMASPLFYSGDMTRLDEFTLNVLCNPEVIAVNQDPLGLCTRVVKLTDDTFLLVKDLADGTKAVGLCNAGEDPVTLTARWSDVGVTGAQTVRDVWRHRDLGQFNDAFRSDVRRRGVVLITVGAVR